MWELFLGLEGKECMECRGSVEGTWGKGDRKNGGGGNGKGLV